MRVLVTGSKGFIGKNLVSHLRELDDIEIVEFDSQDKIKDIEKELKSIDFIFHLAGSNRPKDIKEYYKVNTDLTKEIVDLLEKHSLKIPLLLASSIQAEKDNDYGLSKKQAEDIVIKYKKKNKAYIYRLHNVFGKWCKPNYNSVVATFCYNIAHNIDITINDKETQLNLVYIDDVVKEFIKVLKTSIPTVTEGDISYIKPIYNYKLGEMASLLKSFKENMTNIYVPDTGNEFIKKLFSTYMSYVDLDGMVIEPEMHIDERGSFTELVKTISAGQFSVSVSKPGIVRGNHYHHTKVERFIVVRGSAKISFRSIITNEVKDYYVSDKKLEIVNIPVGYTHNIENLGKDEMILLIWCNEILDRDNPDTYFMQV